jgi:hypothetical protein
MTAPPRFPGGIARRIVVRPAERTTSKSPFHDRRSRRRSRPLVSCTKPATLASDHSWTVIKPLAPSISFTSLCIERSASRKYLLPTIPVHDIGDAGRKRLLAHLHELRHQLCARDAKPRQADQIRGARWPASQQTRGYTYGPRYSQTLRWLIAAASHRSLHERRCPLVLVDRPPTAPRGRRT